MLSIYEIILSAVSRSGYYVYKLYITNKQKNNYAVPFLPNLYMSFVDFLYS